MYGISVNTGETFKKKDDQACYLFTVMSLPREWQIADEMAIKVFETRRAAIWRVISNNMGLCWSMATKYGIYEEETIRDVGISTLLRCVRSYQVNSGVKFSTYASAALKREYYKSQRRKYRHIDVARLTFNDQVCTEVEREALDQVQYTLKQLSVYERILLTLRFWKGLTYEELGSHFDVSKATIGSDLKSTLLKCRQILDKEGDKS